MYSYSELRTVLRFINFFSEIVRFSANFSPMPDSNRFNESYTIEDIR